MTARALSSSDVSPGSPYHARGGHCTLALVGKMPQAKWSGKSPAHRNCAEAVINVDYLWKYEENEEDIQPQIRTDAGGSAPWMSVLIRGR